MVAQDERPVAPRREASWFRANGAAVGRLALVLLVAAAVISYPLLFHRLEPYALPELPDESFSERDALLEALSELKQALRAGKISPADYEAQRGRLERGYVELVEGEGEPGP